MALRVAVFASGGGSNFQALTECARYYSVALLVSNHPRSGALKRAHRLGVPSSVLSPRTFESEELYTDALLDLLQKESIELIALAGYLLKIPSRIIHAFPEKILNIHPALLPRFGGRGFYGRRVHEAVLEAGESFSGATVHFVDEEYDTGPILLQERVPIRPNDTADSLATRILNVEHQLFPKALNLMAQGCVQIQGRHVTILPSTHDH